MSDMPDNIWAIHVHIDDATWYECPVPDTEKYIRADIHEAKIKELEKALIKIANQHTVDELIKKGVENSEYDDKISVSFKQVSATSLVAYGKMILVARDALAKLKGATR